MARYTEWTLDELSPGQLAAYDRLVAGPRGGVAGPFRVWLRNAELANRAQSLGAYIRWESHLGADVLELAVLIVAAHWATQFEWDAHEPLARAAGVADATIEAVRHGTQADLKEGSHLAVWRLVAEILNDHRVGDETWQAAVDCIGEAGVVDLIAAAGYYSMIAMTLRAFEI